MISRRGVLGGLGAVVGSVGISPAMSQGNSQGQSNAQGKGKKHQKNGTTGLWMSTETIGTIGLPLSI